MLPDTSWCRSSWHLLMTVLETGGVKASVPNGEEIPQKFLVYFKTKIQISAMCGRLPLLAASSLEPPSQLVTTPHSGPMAENQVPWLQASTWKMKRCYPTCHGQQIQCGHMDTCGQADTCEPILLRILWQILSTQFSICEGPFWLTTALPRNFHLSSLLRKYSEIGHACPC